MNLNLYEQETIINFCRAEQKAIIETAEPRLKTKLKKLIAEYPDEYKVVKEDEYFLAVELDKSLISVRSPRKSKGVSKELPWQTKHTA